MTGAFIGGQTAGHVLEDVAGDVFRRGIEAVEGRHLVDDLMVEGGQLFLEGALEDLEVQQQLHIFGEFVAFHGQLHGEIVAVQTLALAFVMAQGMACGNLVTHRKAPDLLGHILSFGWSGPARVHS